MKTNSQYDSVKALTPNQLSTYLLSQNWIEDGRIGDVASVWHRRELENKQFELVLPLKLDLKDYQNSVLDLIKKLSEFEKRSLSDVSNSLSNFNADVIKIRVIHEDVESGSIPLNDGVLLFEKAKELLISVVRSTFNKRKYFSGGKLSGELFEYIENMRLGQTEHGSYIVNLIAPITPPEELEQQDHSKVSMTRAVSDTLARSLSAIKESVQNYQTTRRESSFDEAVQKGASANLCDALIGLSGENQSRNVKVSISLSKIETDTEELELEHDFNSTIIPYLKTASNYYKENYIIRDQTITGTVTKLKHEEDDEIGVITIMSSVNGEDKHVSFELSIEKYWEAHQAHKESQFVECFGDLHVTPRSAKLINPARFRVCGTGDLFSEE